MKNFVKLLITICIIFIQFYLIGCGNDTGTDTYKKNKKAKIEYDWESIIPIWWSVSFSQQTIPTDPNNSFEYYVTPNNTGNLGYYRDIVTSTVTECPVLCILRDTTLKVRSCNQLEIPFYICQSYSLWTLDYLYSLCGIANFNENPTCGCGINFAYQFSKNCDLAMANAQINLNERWDFYNTVITHELGHQIARMYGDDAHTTHDGPIQNYCVMWQPFTSRILDSVSKEGNLIAAYMCPRHVDKFRNGTELSNPNISKNVIQNEFKYFYDLKNNKDSSNNFKISLGKSEYKLYEPILTKFEYINNHNKIDTIFFNFTEPYNNSITFYVISNNNEIFKSKIHSSEGFIVETPQFFIEPKDTFVVGMNLNRNNGELVSPDDFYLGNYGYYPEGDYRIYAEGKVGNSFVKTNEVTFKVISLNEEDKEVLNLIKMKKYDDIFSKYSSNPFTEHAMAFYCTEEIYPVENWNSDINLINNTFGNFIMKYPNSFHNIRIVFVNGYFTKITNYTSDIDSAIENMNVYYPDNLFYKFITRKAVREKIITNFNILKDILNKHK
jgi:hypothetical protein